VWSGPADELLGAAVVGVSPGAAGAAGVPGSPAEMTITTGMKEPMLDAPVECQACPHVHF